jgi:deazaflavin-dependent oxidoreductase (nitroreductase family)
MSHMTAARNRPVRGVRLGSRTRAVIRFVARFVNPLTLLVAGRGWMPVVGILRHKGRRSGRVYPTPLGMRRLGDLFFMPLTFSQNAAWYRNVAAAGTCSVSYLGRAHTLVEPRIVDFTTATPAFPRYELWQFRLVGIDEYLVMRTTNGGS